ncbi:isocitrate lyase/PEP mutase family protein [Bradyrhizobium sp. C-145]|uniref:isocitrate lyase/PEP mutase family protein n=1 Tax=Bradyrhizobium sp. C-145 TaxID=574727 RepID=UPI00201B5D19|nr:isocitrate lyase/PEP mutase family protein [Bradyrhizobium sp. C-145]UQR68107.1 isocitrate lyase/PEP mutase family protein [Bradyrhizobium sp. C-145]
MHLLGIPDSGLHTLTEVVENTRRVCQAVSIPVSVDCDTGFGNAINVVRTVDAIIRAGAASLFIEDQVAPKRCGFVKGKELIPIEEAVGKYRAACDVRNELDPDFVIMARTDARGAVGGSIDEVMRRGEAYLNAGVDILYVEALQSREEMWAVRRAFPDAMLLMTPWAINPRITTEEMRKLGVVSTYVHFPAVGSIAMYDFLVDFVKRGDDAYNEFAIRTEDHPLGGWRTFDLVGFPKVHELEQKYLPAEALARYDNSIGVYDPRNRSAKHPDAAG